MSLRVDANGNVAQTAIPGDGVVQNVTIASASVAVATSNAFKSEFVWVVVVNLAPATTSGVFLKFGSAPTADNTNVQVPMGVPMLFKVPLPGVSKASVLNIAGATSTIVSFIEV